MGDAESNTHPSKKRAAGVQLTKDNPGLDDDEEASEQELGSFKRASDEVLAARRFVKVRRKQTSSASAPNTGPASNPFAAIRLIPAASPPMEFDASDVKRKETEQIDKNDSKSVSKVNQPKGESIAEEEKTEDVALKAHSNAHKDESTGEERETEGHVSKSHSHAQEDESTGDEEKPEVDESKAHSDAQKDESDEVSKQTTDKYAMREVVESGADAGITGTETRKDEEGKETDKEKDKGDAATGKNVETTTFNSFHQLSSSQNAFSGLAGSGFSSTSFSFGSGFSNNGNTSIFGSSGPNIVSKSEGNKFPPMQEVSVETGEENENAVFTADSVLFEYIDGAWKERGKGEVKVSVPTAGIGKARLIMRARGYYRLILNASLFPEMKLKYMDKRGITFACVNNAGEKKHDGLSTVALKFKDASFAESFLAAVEEHKGMTPKVSGNTPETSPKASDQ